MKYLLDYIGYEYNLGYPKNPMFNSSYEYIVLDIDEYYAIWSLCIPYTPQI